MNKFRKALVAGGVAGVGVLGVGIATATLDGVVTIPELVITAGATFAALAAGFVGVYNTKNAE